MTTSLTPTAPATSDRPPRRFGWIGWTSVCVLLSCMLALGLFELAASHPTIFSKVNSPPSAAPPPVPACMSYDDFLDVEPGKVVSLAVNVTAERCGTNAYEAAARFPYEYFSAVWALQEALARGSITQADFDTRYNRLYDETTANATAAGLKSRQDVTIGSKVKVNLAAPLFDGTVAAVADEIQTFDETHTVGRWQWQLRPNTPGDFQLPLKLTIYDKDGKEVLTEERILDVYVHVPVTAHYVAGSIWTGIAAFFTSLQGLVASIGGVAAGTAGFRAWAVRRSKKGATNPAPAVAPTGGYL